VFSNNRLERADPPPARTWTFLAPFDEQDVVPLSLAETITISRHLRVPAIQVFMNLAPLEDLRDPETPPPAAIDETGCSSQIFVMDVIAQKGQLQRRIVAQGRDIYAVTAPIVVEAAQRVIAGGTRRGVLAAGEAFDARDFLNALHSTHMTVEYKQTVPLSLT
jgi:hypothetical protein